MNIPGVLNPVSFKYQLFQMLLLNKIKTETNETITDMQYKKINNSKNYFE